MRYINLRFTYLVAYLYKCLAPYRTAAIISCKFVQEIFLQVSCISFLRVCQGYRKRKGGNWKVKATEGGQGRGEERMFMPPPIFIPQRSYVGGTSSGGSRENIWGPGPSSFGRQQRLSEITIEPFENLGELSKIWGAVPPALA